MRITLLLLLVGCRTVEATIRAPAPCLQDAPPAARTWLVHRECPVALCLEEAAATAILDELEARRRWDAEAWLTCRPPAAP